MKTETMRVRARDRRALCYLACSLIVVELLAKTSGFLRKNAPDKTHYLSLSELHCGRSASRSASTPKITQSKISKMRCDSNLMGGL